ncbi:unnamed protein product [Sphenostylis stenocarpa]|uniref:Uncharacterized protein n=1 Tax=Sphenostylis stenocarpa TaxID=92480 RepID=A0AA86TQD3_9FABA|nr:unnamed protein product [Sphenostylis stenocarpa]
MGTRGKDAEELSANVYLIKTFFFPDQESKTVVVLTAENRKDPPIRILFRRLL